MKKIKNKVRNGKNMEVVSTEQFIKAINSLGVKQFSSLEYSCLVKVLCTDESEKFIKLTDFTQILEDYGIQEHAKIKKDKSKKTLDFSKLDQLSMILLLALTEYLVKSNTPQIGRASCRERV